jgi:hypothetical protein
MTKWPKIKRPGSVRKIVPSVIPSRRAVDDLSGTDFAPGVAQNWAQFFVSEKSDEANSLKTIGEPGRTRTSNPLIKSQLLYH